MLWIIMLILISLVFTELIYWGVFDDQVTSGLSFVLYKTVSIIIGVVMALLMTALARTSSGFFTTHFEEIVVGLCVATFVAAFYVINYAMHRTKKLKNKTYYK